MKMMAAMIVIYGVFGLAAIFAPLGLIDSKLALTALLPLYSAHFFWRVVAKKRDRSADTGTPE